MLLVGTCVWMAPTCLEQHSVNNLIILMGYDIEGLQCHELLCAKAGQTLHIAFFLVSF